MMFLRQDHETLANKALQKARAEVQQEERDFYKHSAAIREDEEKHGKSARELRKLAKLLYFIPSHQHYVISKKEIAFFLPTLDMELKNERRTRRSTV